MLQTKYKPYNINQEYLLPPSLKEWLPENDLVYFIIDLVNQFDLRTILKDYDNRKGGQPAYHPEMMTCLLLYAYCNGMFSSRRIEKATYYQISLRVLTGNQQPDHDTIAEFRRRHLKALAGLFVQVLKLCRKAGLVKLGHVSLDGTKVKANASKHKAMSYGRMEKKIKELEEDVQRLFAEAEKTDLAEDKRYGKTRRGDELPQVLRTKQSRLAKIREAKKALEEEAEIQAQEQREEQRCKEAELKSKGEKARANKSQASNDKPGEKAQRNFTDSDSRIMKDGASKSFEQAYNCQATVDAKAQIIIATHVTQAGNDKNQVMPALVEMEKNLGEAKPKKMSMDNGYYSEANAKYLEEKDIDAYIATGGKKQREHIHPPPRGRLPKATTIKERMTRKLETIAGRKIYAKRKHIAEPVFGQIKEVRGFRRFLLRGFEQVSQEWQLVSLTHNMLKLFRSGKIYAPA